MGETKEEFDPISFEKKLTQLKDTQDSIQSMSAWCLQRRNHHKKVVASWLNVLKRVKIEQRLTLFYLANDVIQYSKRKNYEFVDSWGLNLQKATPLVRDDKVRHKILRIFKIWEERSVYDQDFLSDLTGLLTAGGVKKASDDDALDFQPMQLVNKIKQCTVLESDTDERLKQIHECKLELSDADQLCATLKEKRNIDEVEKELAEGIDCVERYTKALQREIVARETLLALLATAHQYYATQRGEVKVVANAYKNFGARVRCLKRKLDELIDTLPARVTPSPPRPQDVPSPTADDDLPLPDDDENSNPYNPDKTFSNSIDTSMSYSGGGFTSFLNSDNNPLALFKDDSSTNRIEVIGGRKGGEDFSISDFLKNLSSENGTARDNAESEIAVLPGLDLLTGEVQPPTSFYGSQDTSLQDESDAYQPESVAAWSNPQSWTSTPAIVAPPSNPDLSQPPPPVIQTAAAATVPPPPPLLYTEAPASPPITAYTADLTTGDVDHRGLLPPPPPPPMIPNIPINLGSDIEDVDHRMLPAIAPTGAPSSAVARTNPLQDVDHRNLISLTSQHNQALPPPTAIDQDYRLPPPQLASAGVLQVPSLPLQHQIQLPASMLAAPPPTLIPTRDNVESVDMDLSEDEEHMHHQEMYNHQQNFNQYYNSQGNKPNQLRNNGTKENSRHTNLIRINSIESNDTETTDMKPLTNPFDSMPDLFNPEAEEPEPMNLYEGIEPEEKFPRPDPQWNHRNFNQFPRRPFRPPYTTNRHDFRPNRPNMGPRGFRPQWNRPRNFF